MDLSIPIKLLKKNVQIPSYATKGSSGMDLRAACDSEIQIFPGKFALIPCGFAVLIPEGYEIQVRSRSGLALKNGIICMISPGTIDSDYRGEIKILLLNCGEEKFIVEPNMRIAQMILARSFKMNLEQVRDLPESQRSADGFGSTGLK